MTKFMADFTVRGKAYGAIRATYPVQAANASDASVKAKARVKAQFANGRVTIDQVTEVEAPVYASR